MSACKTTVTGGILTVANTNGAAEIVVKSGASQGRIRMQPYDGVPAEIHFAMERCPAQNVT